MVKKGKKKPKLTKEKKLIWARLIKKEEIH